MLFSFDKKRKKKLFFYVLFYSPSISQTTLFKKCPAAAGAQNGRLPLPQLQLLVALRVRVVHEAHVGVLPGPAVRALRAAGEALLHRRAQERAQGRLQFHLPVADVAIRAEEARIVEKECEIQVAFCDQYGKKWIKKKG